MARNPFRVHGVARAESFADRDNEIARIRATFDEPGAKLLVYGPRRMGKTSTLVIAKQQHIAAGGIACLADFSTATSEVDLANRVLKTATDVLGKRWRDSVLELARKIGPRIELSIDAVTGAPTAALGLGAREAAQNEQRETLGQVLDGLEEICKERKASLGLVMDEFQEITRLGGTDAEWQLRGIIQHHHHISYVASGSKTHLIRRMISQNGAFYKFFDLLAFQPIDRRYFASWIDEQMANAGVNANRGGSEIVRIAGPRTRDIIQLARKVFDIAVQDGVVGVEEEAVLRAFTEIVQEESELLQSLWAGYSPLQQNVLRAVAAGEESLTAANTRQKYSLRTSSAATQAAQVLVEQGTLEQSAPGHYRFDNPFQRAWVIVSALPDIGIVMSPIPQEPIVET